MEALGVLENEYYQDIWSRDGSKNRSEWNTRKVNLLNEDERVLLKQAASSSSQIYLMMSKPDRGDVEISGGYDETRGGYIEGKISASWGDPKPSPDSEDKP